MSISWPNRITLTRVLLVGPFTLCLLYLHEPGRDGLRRLALGIYAIMAASDFIDGYLARRLGQITDLGRFLDPLADKLLVVIAVVVLSASGLHDPAQADGRLWLPLWVAVAAVGKDLAVSLGFAILYLITGRVFIQPRPIGKWCTMVLLVMVLLMLLWPEFHTPRTGPLQALWWGATAMAVAATMDYVRSGVRFLTEQPEKNSPQRR